jgi:hypothetical protein
MNIKLLMFHAATRVERLIQSIFGVSVASVPPARASVAGRSITRVGKVPAMRIPIRPWLPDVVTGAQGTPQTR